MEFSITGCGKKDLGASHACVHPSYKSQQIPFLIFQDVSDAVICLSQCECACEDTATLHSAMQKIAVTGYFSVSS